MTSPGVAGGLAHGVSGEVAGALSWWWGVALSGLNAQRRKVQSHFSEAGIQAADIRQFGVAVAGLQDLQPTAGSFLQGPLRPAALLLYSYQLQRTDQLSL